MSVEDTELLEAEGVEDDGCVDAAAEGVEEGVVGAEVGVVPSSFAADVGWSEFPEEDVGTGFGL